MSTHAYTHTMYIARKVAGHGRGPLRRISMADAGCFVFLVYVSCAWKGEDIHAKRPI